MNRKLKLPFHLPALSLFGAIILLISACSDDDDSSALSLLQEEYNAANHVYAMSMNPSFEAEEAIIDPATGAFGLLEGTKESMGGLDIPIGPRFLTDFVNNRRIYQLGGNEGIIIQDLKTLEKTQVVIDPIQTSITDWDFLTFGSDNNTLLGYDLADSRVFALDIPSQTLTVIAEGLPNFNFILKAFYYLPESNELVFFEQDGYSIYDLTNQFFLQYGTFSKELFGFVKHPVTAKIYALSQPTSMQGFRLVELIRTNNDLMISEISTEDLPIDDLSPNLQTIHTASNTFICKGGVSDFNNPETFLYSIDLNNGQLIHDVKLEGFGVMLKLRGE